MQPFPPTIVFRHRKENLKKCSLRGLELRKDFIFQTYPLDSIPDLTGYIILDLEAPPLTIEDKMAGLLVIDATWRHAGKMVEQLKPHTQNLKKRSIPNHFRTAYPRRQNDCPNPELGLASLEAIFIAYHILERDVSDLLEGYYWKENFLKINRLNG